MTPVGIKFVRPTTFHGERIFMGHFANMNLRCVVLEPDWIPIASINVSCLVLFLLYRPSLSMAYTSYTNSSMFGSWKTGPMLGMLQDVLSL